MSQVPVVTRTQRRLERRQMILMLILVLAVTGASFFLGIMVGERNATRQENALNYSAAAQVLPPPQSVEIPAGSQRLTFYEDLPKGNSAPLGSGINLPPAISPGTPSPSPAVKAANIKAPEPMPEASAATKAAISTPAVPKTPPPTPAPVTVTAPKAVVGSMVVQVSATKNQAEAKRLVEKLRGQGFNAYSERADLGSKGVWYRVIAGPYADRAAAEKTAAQLKKQKYSTIVRSR